jgi:hypothetical protein
VAPSKQLQRLTKIPADMMRFQATGKLPVALKAISPLITLLEYAGNRDR